MKTRILMITIAVLMLASIGAYAADSYVNFWFTLAGSTEKITGDVVVPVGATQDFSLWYATDLTATQAISIVYGFDTCTKMGTTGVTPIENKLQAVGVATGRDSAVWGGTVSNALGGGYASGTTVRPYGLVESFNATVGTTVAATAGTKLFDFTLKNIAVTTPYVTGLYVNAAAPSFATSLVGKNAQGVTTTLRPGATTLTIVPEPSALLALGSGLVGLAGFVIRRKK